MSENQRGKCCFIDQMSARLLEYQIDKIKRMDNAQSKNSELYVRERQAREALIDLENDSDSTRRSEEDVGIGRWSQYRVPDKLNERLSLGKRPKNGGPLLRYVERGEPSQLHYNCLSERTIPRLKVMLHQLEHPFDPSPVPARRISESSRMMKTQIGKQALVISNKQEIKPSVKSERKLFSTIDAAANGVENKRPPSSQNHCKQANPSNSYHKIKRQLGFQTQPQDLRPEKEILSQILKGKFAKPTESTPLASMLDYFTMTAGKKKKTTAKLGLDKLLS